MVESPPIIKLKLFQDYCEGKGLEDFEKPTEKILAALRLNRVDGMTPCAVIGWGHEIRGETSTQTKMLPLSFVQNGLKLILGDKLQRGDILHDIPSAMIDLMSIFQPDLKDATILKVVC